MSEEFIKPSFSIIKKFGSPNEATTVDGYKVGRHEHLLIPQLGGFIRCAPYDDHFIYLDPSGKVGRWWIMCTCGSPGIYVGSNAYDEFGSPEGMMLVCKWHLDNGVHATGGRKWE